MGADVHLERAMWGVGAKLVGLASASRIVSSIPARTEERPSFSTVLNTRQIRRHEDAVHQRSARHGVANPVDHARAAGHGLEAVLVHPGTIRSANLRVDEQEGRVPNGDLACPVEGDAVQAQHVVDPRSRLHADGARTGDPELQPRRRHHLQVFGVCKKRKDVPPVTVDDLGTIQLVDAHGVPLTPAANESDPGGRLVPYHQAFPGSRPARSMD
jgi:hypothetical protein